MVGYGCVACLRCDRAGRQVGYEAFLCDDCERTGDLNMRVLTGRNCSSWTLCSFVLVGRVGCHPNISSPNFKAGANVWGDPFNVITHRQSTLFPQHHSAFMPILQMPMHDFKDIFSKATQQQIRLRCSAERWDRILVVCRNPLTGLPLISTSLRILYSLYTGIDIF